MQDDFGPNPSPLVIADRLALLKDMRADVNRRVHAAEALLIEALGFDRPKGSRSYPMRNDDGSEMRIEITRPVSYSLDREEWELIEDSFEEDEKPIRTKYEPEMKAVARLKAEAPELYELFTRALVSKPGKPQIKIEYKENHGD